MKKKDVTALMWFKYYSLLHGYLEVGIKYASSEVYYIAMAYMYN